MSVHVREIHPALHGLTERIHRSDDVVAIEPEVQREMVPRAGGDDHHGDAVSSGDARHQRLRAISAGHADHVGASLDGSLRELEQIVPGTQDHRLDPPLPAFILQVEALGLPAPGLQVHDQHASSGGRHMRARKVGLLQRSDVATQREPSERNGQQEQHDPKHQRWEPGVVEVPGDQDPHDRGDGDHGGDQASNADARERVPGRERRDREERELHHDSADVADHDRARPDDDDHRQDDRGYRGESAPPAGRLGRRVHGVDDPRSAWDGGRPASCPPRLQAARVTRPTPAPTHRPPTTSVSQCTIR